MADSSPSEHPLVSPWHSRVDDTATALLQKIMQHAVELLNLEACTLALLDEQKMNLRLIATSQEELDTLASFPLHTSPLAEVVEEQQPRIFSSTQLDMCRQLLGGDKTHTLACLPLLDRQQVLGVLLARASSAEAFAPQKLHLLALLAEQATLTLLNARQAELLRDANRTKANFLSLVTHELRSPLNAINGYLDLTLEGLAGELSGQQREFLQHARAGSEHLYTLIEDLLLTSRVDAGQLRLSRTPVALERLVSDALEELELTARNAEVKMQAEIPAAFPNLVVDEVRMQQVLRNLLCNAIHWTPAGGHVTISARHVVERRKVEIRVTDTGCGIAPIYHERIFERFFQVPHSAGNRVSGQGLGLAVVKMVVELHGGRVWVESVPGEGCTFVVVLNGDKL